ncbi:GNAT family N-acetyltransferase [[Clostridium] polysaccharolyticum]|uniref:GNAT acetyltransferase n=1 Tax=[Clostridium] polysaccharolyticum TaxID=29364 RepID=A0A1I0D9X6_9FIRM|nr:GNAT family N-acetyltransferase [[Clostridium] polysaccharolyticum]SET28471.1 GNAT acetyltransferase [[Clostridium] polysaccharolyticum]
MIRLKKEQLDRIKEYESVLHDSTCFTVIQGLGGGAFVDSVEKPESLVMVYGDFSFYFGELPDGEIEKQLNNMFSECDKTWSIMVPESPKWLNFFKESGTFYESCRYRLKKRTEPFDRRRLQEYVRGLSKDYELTAIDEKWFEELKKDPWGKDLCTDGLTGKEFAEHALGFLVLRDGKPVAGISSYAFYDKGLEIEIDTKKAYRKKGLATVLGAKFILECTERGLYPNWDAANLISVKLAEKLGYEFDREYPVYSNRKLYQMKLGE